MAAVETVTRTVPSLATLTLRPEDKDQPTGQEATYRYAHLLPTWNTVTYPPLTPFEHSDPGIRALEHENPRAFLENATKIVDLTPHLGTEVQGVNLAALDSAGRDQLALEVARRGLMVFRDQQEFIDRGPDFYLEWGRHFGRLHIHPTSGHPENYPEIHLVHRDSNSTSVYKEDSITATGWHSDVSYERQPPGLTTFFLLDSPTTGGDTLFISQVAALKRLSPQFVDFLRTLKALHSGVDQADFAKSGKRGKVDGRGIVRREPVENVHPVIRKHPVTGTESLYVNRQFTRRIVGLKREESDNILEFLYRHIERAGDCQARAKWAPNTVVLWDNRTTAHSANSDFVTAGSTARRHGARITPQAEKPLPANAALVLDD